MSLGALLTRSAYPLAAALWLILAPAALADSDTDAAVAELIEENPSLAEMLRRDPSLADTLRAHPELAARLADKPTLIEKAIETVTNPWVLFGLGAQFLFMMRFLVQWISSERKKRSHVPVVFWYFSIGGGLMLLTYAIHRQDPVFILGQSLGLLIYSRNLILIYRRAWAYRELLAERAERESQRREETNAGTGHVSTEASPAS